MKDRGLRVKLAADDKGNIGGMIQYIPIEHSFAEGRDLYVVLCIWVHGHKKGRGDFTGKGMGTELLKAAEEDVRQLGGKGLAAWGVILPFFMRASWFIKHGYKKVDRDGITALAWKPFTEDAIPPALDRKIKVPEKGKAQVYIDAFNSGWCPALNLVFERTKRAAAVFGNKVRFIEYDSTDDEVYGEWKIMDGIFVNGKEINAGPPPSYEKIHSIIEKQVRKLN